jgi:NAD(P) transhydrogenase subunit alpha
MTDHITITDQAAQMATTAQSLADQAAALALSASTIPVRVGGGGDEFLIMGMIIFVLACFVGYHVVWRVTPALHSPLMAMTNAISSVIIVGALLAAGLPALSWAQFFGFIAVILAAVNIFGGFMVTRRMLLMFKKKS